MGYVGEEIKKYRKICKLSQRELGEKMNVSQAMIAQYESGKRIPKLSTMAKLSDALQIDLRILANAYQLDIAFYSEVDRMNLSDNKKIKQEEQLLTKYRSLNERGQEKALEQLELLAKIPEYQKTINDSPLPLFE